MNVYVGAYLPASCIHEALTRAGITARLVRKTAVQVPDGTDWAEMKAAVDALAAVHDERSAMSESEDAA